jgi:hypothetical protein
MEFDRFLAHPLNATLMSHLGSATTR